MSAVDFMSIMTFALTFFELGVAYEKRNHKKKK